MAKKFTLDDPVQSPATIAHVPANILIYGANDPQTARIVVELGGGHDDPSSPGGLFIDRTELIELNQSTVRDILESEPSYDGFENRILLEATKKAGKKGTIS